MNQEQINCLQQLQEVIEFDTPQVSKIDFKPGEYLRETHFGKVYEGISFNTGELIDLQYIQVPFGKNREIINDTLHDELIEIKTLDFRNLIKYKDIQISQQEEHVIIITESVPGCSIRDLIKKFGKLNEKLIRLYLEQIVNSLLYLKERKYKYSKLNCGNLFIDSGGILKMTDYAHFSLIDEHFNDLILSKKMYVEDPLPPEFIHDKKYKYKSDVWQLGISLLEMLTGKPIKMEYSSKTHLQAGDDEIYNNYIDWLPEIPNNITSKLKKFILNCIKVKADERKNIKEIKEYLDSMTKLTPSEMFEIKEDLMKKLKTASSKFIPRSPTSFNPQPHLEVKVEEEEAKENKLYDRLGTFSKIIGESSKVAQPKFSKYREQIQPIAQISPNKIKNLKPIQEKIGESSWISHNN